MNTDPWTMRVAAPVPDPQPLSIRQAELLFAEGRACHAARWALNAHLQKWTLETRQALDRAIEPPPRKYPLDKWRYFMVIYQCMTR